MTNEFQVGDAALLDRCHVLKLDKVALKDFPNLDFRGLYQAIALKIATEMEEKEIPKDLEARYLLLKDCVQRWALSMRNMYGGHGRGFDLDCFWRFGEAALDLVGLPYKVLPSDVSDAEVKEECDLKARLMSEVGKIKGALSDLYAGSDLPHYGIYASTRAGVKGLFLTPNAVSSLTGMSFRKAASRGLGEITSTVKANVRMTGLRVSMLGHWDFPLETPENFEITEKDLKDVEVEVGRVPLPAKEESEAWKVDDDVTEYYRQRGKRW